MSTRRHPDSGQPIGMCSYCGTGILYCFRIRSRDGREFVVGSDCVLKTASAFDYDPMTFEVRKLVLEAEREKRSARRQARHEALRQRVQRAKALMEADPHLFTAEPHPHDYFAKQGLRMRDYFDWTFRYGSDSARTAACRTIETACGESANRES